MQSNFRYFLLLALCSALLVTPVSSRAEAPAPAGAELTELLHRFLAGVSAGDPAAHERFWAGDLIYTSSTGERFGRQHILDGARAPQDPEQAQPSARYRAEDVQILQFGDTAVVAFRLLAELRSAPDAAPEHRQYLNTGTFVRREGEWRAVAWQATSIPAPASE